MPLRVAQQAVNGLNDNVDNINILPFVEATDIVSLGNLTFVKDDVNSSCMILYKQPVTYILTLTIYGKGLALTDIVDE